MTARLNVSGVSVPAATPFDADENIAPAELQRNLAWWNQFPLSGYLILGSTSEPFNVTIKERLTIMEAAREAIPSSRLMMVGTGQQTTRETIELTRQAAEIGADAAVVVTPFFYKGAMKPAVLLNHYRAIADASPIPILLYSVPVFTGVTIEPETICALAEHPNIIGMKDSNGNFNALVDTIRQVRPDFQILWGAAPSLFGALSMGAVGATLAVANIAPDLSADIYHLHREGKTEESRQAQLRLARLLEKVVTRFGIGGIKVALELRGAYGGRPRSPMPVPDERGREDIRQALIEAGLL